MDYYREGAHPAAVLMIHYMLGLKYMAKTMAFLFYFWFSVCTTSGPEIVISEKFFVMQYCTYCFVTPVSIYVLCEASFMHLYYIEPVENCPPQLFPTSAIFYIA